LRASPKFLAIFYRPFVIPAQAGIQFPV